MTESGNNSIKVVLVGESGVGKTCIIDRLCFKKYTVNPQSTIGSANVSTTLDYGKETLTLDIWDTAGQETYRSLNRIFYKGAKIAVMVYDITNKASFDEIQKYWLNQIRSVCGEDAVIGLLGNKSDLFANEQVPEQMAKEFAEKNNCLFKQCSAYEGVGIEETFKELGKHFLKDKSEDSPSGFVIKDDKDKDKDPKEKKKCCK